MKLLFDPATFTATQFDTAEAKAKGATLLIRFLETGCPQPKFTQALYHVCYQHLFGHIAHFDRYGFYNTWFERPVDILAFIDRALAHPCYGEPTHTWCDVEQALKTFLRAHPEIRARYATAHETQTRTRELQQLRALKAKYPEEA